MTDSPHYIEDLNSSLIRLFYEILDEDPNNGMLRIKMALHMVESGGLSLH